LFRITARTVLELGAELISSDIIAFYELIKNGFDAEARAGLKETHRKGVEVRFDIVLSRHPFLKFKQRVSEALAARLEDEAELGALPSHEELKQEIRDALLSSSSEEARAKYAATIDEADDFESLQAALDDAQARFNTITVSDRGSGMSRDDLEDAFLVIGTASRKKEVEAALRAGAAKPPFLGEKGIGRLSAMRLGEQLRVETARCDDEVINVLEIDWRAFSNVDAMLDQISISPTTGGDKPDSQWSGTHIIISDLLEQWTEARVRKMCEDEFALLTDPSEDASRRPRIALFWNGERIGIPFMPANILEAAHARVSAEYTLEDGKPLLVCNLDAIDLGFEHPPVSETVVLDPADLQGAIVGKEGEIEDQALVKLGPFAFEAYWYNRRRLSRTDTTGENKALRDLQEQWSGIRVYRDGFRVFPYGEEEDDWLELDRTALRRSGYLLNKTQFIGRVLISRAGNPDLVDQTNREGLRVTPEQQAFVGLIRHSVQTLLGSFMGDVEREFKAKPIDLSGAKDQVEALKTRARNSIRKLRRHVVEPEDKETVADLEQTLLELSDFAERARVRIEQVEKEGRQMVDMAGVGLMVEVVAHELARSSESALKALDRLKGTTVPEHLRGHLNTLRAEMKSLNKRIRILDPLSISGRQRKETFSLNELIEDTIEAHRAQFERHEITPVLELGGKPLRVRAVKGMVVQILENLISNSIYWMDLKRERRKTYEPEICITLGRNPPSITFQDNGRGIAPENAQNVFRPFFSLKDENRRRGLGLFIAREAATYHGGSLTLSDERDPKTNRLHTFVLDLPQDSQL
jgi:signal transduction histidine kinase